MKKLGMTVHLCKPGVRLGSGRDVWIPETHWTGGLAGQQALGLVRHTISKNKVEETDIDL